MIFHMGSHWWCLWFCPPLSSSPAGRVACTTEDKGDKAIDNFDFGDGPVKTEEEKVLAATDRLKKQVSEAMCLTPSGNATEV